MDQSVTIIPNTTQEFLQSQIQIKDERIANLEEHISRVTQRSVGEAAERSRMRNEMHEWTLEAMDNDTISEDTAQEIADICGFELTKEFEILVLLKYLYSYLYKLYTYKNFIKLISLYLINCNFFS